jgi:hypothetical protein
MKIKLFLLAFAVALAVPSLATAQTQKYDFFSPTTFTCSPGGGLYCYGIPLYLNGDTSQPESTVWVDIQSLLTGAYNYGSGFVCFPPAEPNGVETPTPLSPLGCGPAIDPKTVIVQTAPYSLPGRAPVQLPVSVAFSFGDGLGTMALTLGHYYAAGRYASWHTTVTAATIEITQ